VTAQPKGKLIIIGGHEDKQDEEQILKEVAKAARHGKLVLVTVATQEPKTVAKDYAKAFQKLGIDDMAVLDIRIREDAYDEQTVEILSQAKVVFFTGGDQLRITSQIGDSPVFRCMQALYHQGTVIVGTSAGAAAMPATMLISGAGDESSRMSALGMAPGLGFLDNAVIDSHFAERGRMGRLLGAVAQNPKNLGIGIDEDTAIIVEQQQKLRVIGSGAVYILDGSTISYSSLSEAHPEGIISLYDVRLHVLGDGDQFDLIERQPVIPDQAEHDPA
jgi:cyanophycinase